MQSGYGGVSEIQQFMVDGCPPSLFSISTPPPPTNPNAAGAAEIQHHQQKFYQLHQQQPQYQHQQHPSPPMPPQFSHLIHPIPITQQLFHHPHAHPHQFQLFHHHHNLGLDHDSAPEASNSPAPPRPSFLAPAMNFKLGVNGSSVNEDRDGILHGGDDGSESRIHSWHREEESAASIKQPFWRPLDRDYINRNNKRPNSPENNNNNNSSSNYSKKSKEAMLLIEHTANTAAAAAAAVPAAAIGSNYKLFSELEAICKPGSGNIVGGGGGGGGGPNNNQTGSGSALTSDDNPLLPGPAPCPTAIDENHPDHGSDTSRSGDALLAAPPSSSIKKPQKVGSGSSSRRKQRAKRRQEQMSMITAFFESLVKQVMDHQESLHCKFLEVMERKDQERTSRDEAWRKQEAARNVGKAASRAQERALAASREASIISFLEKITGESLNLPQFPFDKSHKDQECNALDLYINVDGGNNNSITNSVQLNTSRWPKAEVQSLIRVRSGLETRFQEPGLKGPLWEEVSSMMAAIGYQRSAKRCKEKWENINKYFRKTKDSGKKRPQHSKTCPYFHQLDQLYSKSSTAPSSSANAGVSNDARKENSELLDAIVVSNDHQSYKFADIGSMRTGINGNEAGSSAILAGKSHGNYEEEDDDDDNDNEEGMDGEEGEGDSQEQGHAQERIDGDDQNEHHHHLHQGLEDPQHDSTFFFQRLRS